MNAQEYINMKAAQGQRVIIHDVDNYEFGGEPMAGSEKGREITPHKGGRDKWAPRARMTEDERNRLDKVMEERGESFADWIMRHVEQDEKRK